MRALKEALEREAIYLNRAVGDARRNRAAGLAPGPNAVAMEENGTVTTACLVGTICSKCR